MKPCQTPFRPLRNLAIYSHVVVIFAVLMSILVPDRMAKAVSNPFSNPFADCDCVNLGYSSAPEAIQRLIHWSLGAWLDNYPKPPNVWVPWSAALWPENIERFGPLLDYRLDWDAAVDATPEVGALVVWSGGSTVTWTVDGIRYAYSHEAAGHIAVVTAYDPATNTISVQEKNWGVCNPPERHNIDVSDAMTFIHEPQPLYASEMGGGVPMDVQGVTIDFSYRSLFPLRDNWGKSVSPFELHR